MKSILSIPSSTLSRSPIAQWRALLPLAVASIMSLSLTSPALANETMLKTVTVTGTGIEYIPATLAQVTLGVEVQAETAEAAQREAAQRQTAVVDYLRSQNVARLQTTSLYLSPRYDYSENGNQQVIGYTATNTVSFQVPVDRSGPLMDEAVRRGATRIDGVNLMAEDAAIATAQRQAIREATQDAQAQADAAMSALGLTRGEVVGVQVNGASAPPPIFVQRSVMEASVAAAAPTPIEGGEQQVQVSVTLQISY